MPTNVIEACAADVSAADFSLRAQGQGDPVAAPSIQNEAKAPSPIEPCRPSAALSFVNTRGPAAAQ
jgi:hypothetical protein